MFLPKITGDDNRTLTENAKAGLARKLKVEAYESIPLNYRDRLEFELEVIERKGFSSYFLIYEDIYKFAKDNSIVCGSGRGSGSGSLVIYSLGMSSIDPLKYGLMWERFLSDSRCSDMVYDYFNKLES